MRVLLSGIHVSSCSGSVLVTKIVLSLCSNFYPWSVRKNPNLATVISLRRRITSQNIGSADKGKRHNILVSKHDHPLSKAWIKVQQTAFTYLLNLTIMSDQSLLNVADIGEEVTHSCYLER